MRLSGILVALLLLSACGCKNGDKSGGTIGNGNGNPPPKGHTAAECDGLSAGLGKMYATAAVPGETPEAATLREQEGRDNVAMVLADCRKDPDRVVPCAQSATSAQQLERDCVLPLDDEGNVEQQQFAKPR